MSAVIIPASQYRAPNVRIITYGEIDKISGVQETYLKNIFRQYRGKTIQASKRHYSLSRTETINDTQIIDVPISGFNFWWESFTKGFIYPDSEYWIFSGVYNPAGSNVSEQAQLTIMTADKVGQSNYEQFFLDGTSHCVFTPIMNWAIDLSMNAQSESTKRKYDAKTKKIQKFINEFNTGVPAKDIPRICNDLQIGIEIDLPSSLLDKNTEFIKIRSQKKPIKIFKFINTRVNHIELNEITNKTNYEEVSQTELQNIYDNNTEFKLWKGDREGGLYQINTLNNVYKLTEQEGYSKEVKDFSDLNRLDEFKIEHNANKLLSKFLLNNLNHNRSLIFPHPTINLFLFNECIEKFRIYPDVIEKEILYYRNKFNDENYKRDYVQGYKEAAEFLEIVDYIKSLSNGSLNHIDLKSAYTRGNDCSYYEGYLGKITDFRNCNKIMGIGIYYIHNIKNIPPLLKNLGILYENNAYPSPELKFYESLGISFDIWGGCWGSKTDINFPNGMFKKDEKGIKLQVVWCLMKLTKKERYNFDCNDIEFAKLNKISENSDIRYNEYKKTGIIEYKKDKCNHSAHIAAFIHSYCRISMIEQLLKFKDISQIVAVQVDGIYYKGDVEICPLFVKKPPKDLKYIQGDSYVIDCENDKIKLPKSRIHNRIEVHTGPGGAGKTHNNLIDKGLIAPLYVAPSWKLARNKAQEYNIDCTVFHYLITKDPDIYSPYLRNYNTLIIDEISMLNDNDKNIIIERFKYHKIIFCGDLGYQLPPVEGSEFKINKLPVYTHRKNYRCQCTKLQNILTALRKLIRQDFLADGRGNLKELILKLDFEIYDKNNIPYKVEDLIITKTHKNKDFYSQRYKDMQKYIVKENTRDYSNGQIIIGNKPDGVNCELQHAYTIHSIQGETCKEILYIDINKMNSLKMLYTALSRAKLFSQIKIIE